MQTYLQNLEKISSDFGGLRQIYNGYDALSWLLLAADTDTIRPEGCSFLLQLLNERFAQCLDALDALLAEQKCSDLCDIDVPFE